MGSAHDACSPGMSTEAQFGSSDSVWFSCLIGFLKATVSPMRFASKMPRRGGVILLTVLAVSPIGCERGQTPDEVKYLGNEAAVQQHMKTVEAEERANRGEMQGDTGR